MTSSTAITLCAILALGMTIWFVLMAQKANKRREYGNVQTFAFLAGAHLLTAILLIFMMVEMDSAVTTWIGENVCPTTICESR